MEINTNQATNANNQTNANRTANKGITTQAEREAIRQGLLKQREDVLERLFVDGMEGRETPQYLVKNMPPQQEIADELDKAFREGFGIEEPSEWMKNLNQANAGINYANGGFTNREIDMIGKGIRDTAQQKADELLRNETFNTALYGINTTAGAISTAHGGYIEPLIAMGEKSDRNIITSNKKELKYNNISSKYSYQAIKTAGASLAKNKLSVLYGITDTAELMATGYQYGTDSEEFRLQGTKYIMNRVVDIATNVAMAGAFAAMGAAVSPALIATAAIAVIATTIGSVYYAANSDEIAQMIYDGTLERKMQEILPTDSVYYENIAEQIEQYGFDTVVENIVLAPKSYYNYLY